MRLPAFCFVLALGFLLVAQEKEPPTAQTKRGRDLFLKSPKGTACATCHSMGGLGTAVGPNLARLTSLATPRGLIAAMQMSITENVQRVQTKEGTFPGIQQKKEGEDYEIWDLGTTPPVLRKLTSKDITSMARDQQWKHPGATTDYTTQELADIVGFLKWATNGSQREIKVSDIE